MILLCGLIHPLAHMADDLQSELLCIFAFSMMLADQRLQAFCQADEAHGERSLLDHFLQRIFPLQLVRAEPYALSHQEREVLDLLAGLDGQTL